MSDEELSERIIRKVTQNLNKVDKEQRMLKKQKSDRSVFEGVFDKSTLMILNHIMNAGVFRYLDGVIASGKESGVYAGVTAKNTTVAVKIYTVTSSEFRHRSQYIAGDPRFGVSRKGIRNIVNLWAKKEFKNLRTACYAKIPVPKPIYVKGNVLVMEFIEEDGIPAPTLNLCEIERKYYLDILKIVSRLYKAKLVHADLSEYNVFLHKNKPMIFDFGSAVSILHPNAEKFLMRDLVNINRFFNKKGIDVYESEKEMKVVKKV